MYNNYHFNIITKCLRLLFSNPLSLYYKIKCRLFRHNVNYFNMGNISLLSNFSCYTITKFKPNIIIPIFNGYAYLVTLVEQLLSHTHITYHLILIDDCSTDSRVLSYLDKTGATKMATKHQITIIRNESNLGFVKTVNIGMRLSTNHFIILNTDTEVPRDFAIKLLQPIINDPKIASTTPYTNSGSICSFPNIIQDNPIFMDLEVQLIDDMFGCIDSSHHNQEIPTGVGFCMGMNKQVYDVLGGFDAATFGRGYGEETDWCLRARKAGYRNIHVTNCFVYHKHGGSFTTKEKELLLKDNYQKLVSRHKNYALAVDNYLSVDTNSDLRIFMQLFLLTKYKFTNCIINTIMSGGTKSYLNNCIEDNQQAQIIIVVESNNLTSRCKVGVFSKYAKLEFQTKNVFLLLEQLGIDVITINHLAFNKNNIDIIDKIINLKNITNAPLNLIIHDYYYICPTINLLNNNNTYCGVPADASVCNKCLKSYNRKCYSAEYVVRNKTYDITQWRSLVVSLLDHANSIIVPSESVEKIFCKVYPGLQKKLQIKLHNLEYLLLINNRITYTPFQNLSNLTVGIIGEINKHKGSNIVYEMIKIAKSKNIAIQWVIIGTIYPYKKHQNLLVTGKYSLDNLQNLINHYKPDLMICPSIWPETFCYTVSEMMHFNLPLLSFNIGAQAQRVSKYHKGMLVDNISAQSMFDAIINFKKF